MTVINSNISSLFAQSSLKINTRNQQAAMEQLSTGKRINSAKDDAAGVAISSTMTADIRGLNQAVRNANDGVSLLQTADGALIETTNMLQRMRELAVQSTSGTYSTTQMGYSNQEFAALSTQIDSIAADTKWNGIALGSAQSFTFGATNGGTTIDVTTLATDATTLAVDAATYGVSSASTASTALTQIDSALDLVNSQRATLGAGINQLTYAADNMTNISTNTSASRSQIEDTDYAVATTNLAKSQIVQQAATAMLAQANQQPQSVLALLK